MQIEIRIDKAINNGGETKVLKILKKQGDPIGFSDSLFEVESGKASASVNPEISGVIESIFVQEGDTVTSDKVLAVVNGEKKEAPAKNSGGSFNYFGNLMKPVKEELESDITIIGGGPGGYVAAIHAAKLGAKVVLIEKDNMGGTCLNMGCIPTKSFVRSAGVYSTLKHLEEYGCSAEKISVDIKKVVERKNKVTAQLVQGIKYLMDKHGIKVINGIGKIQDQNTVFVPSPMKEYTVKTKNIIIATGSVPSVPPIPGIDNPNVINSTQALNLNELPKKLAVIGGGVIGMEFAYVFANFGVDVTVIEFLNECLAGCDADVCEENCKNAAGKGIKLYTTAKVEEILKGENNECIVRFAQGSSTKYVSTDMVLLAVGRTPFVDGLNIENAAIELNDNKKGIKVNSRMQTNIPNIYAIGDVTNKVLLAHVASHQGIVAVNNIMGVESEMDYNCIPGAVFTDPEIATVGLSEKAAREKGLEIKVGKFPFAANGKSLTFGENSGFIKLIKEKETGRIVGGCIVGLHATDLIAEVALAIKNNLKAHDIIETIHAHPTTAEVVHEAALSLEGGAIHFA